MPALTPYTVQRFRGGFALVWYEGEKRHRRSLASKDRVSAEAEARRLWEMADDTPWTVGRIVEGYIAELAKNDPPSLQRRKDAWKAMRAYWGNVDPELIDRDMCMDYRDERPVADSTARYELLMLSTALTWAHGKKHIERRPELWLPARDAYRIRYLERDEFEKFFEAIRSPHARLYVLLGLYTMARPSAILELEWSQVDFDRRQIDLNPPGRR
jgi:Phage integrase family.